MFLKAHPSAKNKMVKFDGHKLLHNQIGKLTEVMDNMKTMPEGRQIQQNRPYKPYIHRGRDRHCRHFPVMTKAEKIIDRGLLTGIKEDILLLDPKPED